MGVVYEASKIDVPGVAVGHWTNAEAATGCTVLICGDGAVGGVAVRGGSPGTVETDLLDPMRRVDRVHGLLLSGGSAFGLAATAGVRQWLEERGIGFETRHGYVPIVPGAILYDLGVGDAGVRPDASAGYAACDAATADGFVSGSMGAGTGATVAKALGIDGAIKGGIGSASCVLEDGVRVAAVVAVNAWGGVYDHRDGSLVAGPRAANGSMMYPVEVTLVGDGSDTETTMVNTTIGAVITDTRLDKAQANFVASTAHDGLALAIRPCHTPHDGDTMFCIATGASEVPLDLTKLVVAAVQVTALAVLDAVQSATSLAGVPAVADLS